MAIWRDELLPASFRSVPFHVDAATRAGGRRVALHEFPKKDLPYAEDMGRRAKRFAVNAYVVDQDYVPLMMDLIDACEQEGPGLLVHPTLGEMLVVCENFNCIEERTRGGMATFEIQFVEAGQAPNQISQAATQAAVNSKASTNDDAAGKAVDDALKNGGTIST